MNIFSAMVKPLQDLGKAVSGMADMMKHGGDMIGKLMKGDLPGAMNELSQICQGASKMMSGLGALPGGQMEAGKMAGGDGPGNFMSKMLDMLPMPPFLAMAR